MRIFLALLILTSLAGISKEVLANTDELVTSIHHGGNPFMVVTKDQEGGSQREPGIYGRSQESWRQILKGSVLQDARKGFWLKQLKLSLKDELYHTLLIIDGQLHLMNLFSDPSVPGSTLPIGSAEFPLVEVLTGQKRILPRIKSVDEISILPLEQNFEEVDYQVVLVSVRCDSCSGDGMTFAMAIKSMKGELHGYELLGKPWLIDYRFYPQTQLNGLVVSEQVNGKRTFRLRSGVATDFIMNTDLNVFKHHKEIVESSLKVLMARNSGTGLPPVEVELSNGQLGGSFSPTITFHNDMQSFKFHQHYDMRTHTGRLKVVNDGEEVRSMLIDFKAPGKAAIFGEKEGGVNSIFSADGKLYLASRDSGIHITELGESPAVANKSFEIHEYFVSMEKTADLGVMRRVLFLSTKFADGSGKVDAFRLAFYATGAVLVEDRVQVLNQGLSPDDLVTRVKEHDKQILFDSLTPITGSAEEYKQAFDRSKPLINVTQSSSTKVAYAFGEPLHEINASDFFAYREFAPSPLIANPTGIYPKKVGQMKPMAPTLGEVLSREVRADGELLNEIPVLSEIGNSKNESLGAISLKVMALDATFSKGEKAFKLVVAISSNDRKFASMLVEIPVTFPFKDLLSVRTYMGRKSNDKNIVLVMTYEKEIDGKRQGQTMAYTIGVAAERGAIPSASVNGKEILLAKEALESAQVVDRMVYDEDGRLNFVMTPNIPRDERRFEMFNIFERRTFKPTVEKGIKLIWDAKPSDESDHFEERKIAWRLPTTDLDKRFPYIPKRTKDAEAGYLWGKLFDMLDKLAQEKVGGKMKVLLVPDSMKKYVNEVIMTRYGRRTKERDSNPFNWSNRNLKVYNVDGEAATQDDFLDNLDQIQRQTQGSNIILADMNTIVNIGSPPTKASNFHLRSVTSADDDDEAEFGEETKSEEDVTLPHAFYLLAAGEPIQMEELKQKPPRNYSVLFVSTPLEWEMAKDEASDEMDAGLDDMFEIIDFPLPTPEDRARLLGQLFEDKNIKIFKYNFDAKGISRTYSLAQDAQMTKVMEYAVMRVASEAENSGMDGLNAFVSFRNLFAQELLRDRTVRRSGIIDKAFVERVLTSVFDIPVNLESLPPDDPIFILSRKDAVRKLNDRGVEGPFALKARVIKTMLAILKSDPTKSIPSSHIFIGESGSGKTRMVTGLLDWLYPNKYDFANPGRTFDANSIRINVGKMVESRKDGKINEQLTFEDVRDHINNFLINGFRGAIFFDDFHAAPESVRTQLLGFVRTLMETQGMYNAQNLDGSLTIPVPLRHLHLFINLNPTENQTQIDSFRKKKDYPATFEEVLMASLSTKDMKVERSFLKRWGAIHNLMQFPHGAKAPALSKDILATARDIMLRKQKLVISSAGAIRSVADYFPDMDARTFLSTASSALVDQVDPQHYSGNLFHVVPGRRRIKAGIGSIITDGGVNDDTSDKGRIEHFVERNTKILPLNDSTPESQLHFIRTLLRNYRLPIFEQLTISLEDDPRFSESIASQRNFLLPALMGVRDHINEKPEIPLSELGLDPAGLGLRTSGDKTLFQEIIAEIVPPGIKHFPFPISKIEQSGSWDVLLTGRSDSSANSRPAMITRYFHKITAVIQKNAKKFYQLESLEGLPNAEQWVRHLPTQSTEAAIKPSVEELRELYWKFISDINDPNLRDRSEVNDKHFTPYTIARIFYLLIDRSIADLPWIMIDKHIIRALDQVVQDQVLGQSPAVKSYFFDYKYSPIRASSPELILQLVESSQLSAEYTADSQSNVRQDFKGHCESLLEAQ